MNIRFKLACLRARIESFFIDAETGHAKWKKILCFFGIHYWVEYQHGWGPWRIYCIRCDKNIGSKDK
jgi:hypothetical protein